MFIRRIGSSSLFRRLFSITAIAGFALSVWLAAQAPPTGSQGAPGSPAATPAVPASQPAPSGQNSAPANPSPSNQGTSGQGNTGATDQTKNTAEKGSNDASILAWLWKTDKERQGLSIWLYAALLLLLGAVGGTITAFYSVGEALPGIGGAGLIEPEVARMQAFEDAIKVCATSLDAIQVKLKNCDPGSDDPNCTANLQFVAGQYVEQIKMYEEHVARLRDLISANRWRIWAYGLPMYILIGGATSLLFAKDFLQALLFGYSWSGVVSSIGLKGAAAQKQAVVQDKAQLLSNEIDRLKQQVNRAEQEKKAQLDWFTKALTTAIKGQE